MPWRVLFTYSIEYGHISKLISTYGSIFGLNYIFESHVKNQTFLVEYFSDEENFEIKARLRLLAF